MRLSHSPLVPGFRASSESASLMAGRLAGTAEGLLSLGLRLLWFVAAAGYNWPKLVVYKVPVISSTQLTNKPKWKSHKSGHCERKAAAEALEWQRWEWNEPNSSLPDDRGPAHFSHSQGSQVQVSWKLQLFLRCSVGTQLCPCCRLFHFCDYCFIVAPSMMDYKHYNTLLIIRQNFDLTHSVETQTLTLHT